MKANIDITEKLKELETTIYTGRKDYTLPNMDLYADAIKQYHKLMKNKDSYAIDSFHIKGMTKVDNVLYTTVRQVARITAIALLDRAYRMLPPEQYEELRKVAAKVAYD